MRVLNWVLAVVIAMVLYHHSPEIRAWADRQVEADRAEDAAIRARRKG